MRAPGAARDPEAVASLAPISIAVAPITPAVPFTPAPTGTDADAAPFTPAGLLPGNFYRWGFFQSIFDI